jgi:hypothetical protein
MIRVWQIESFVAEISLMQKVWGQSIQVGDKREPGQNMSLRTLCHHVIHIIAWFQALETGMDLRFIEDQIFTARKLEGNSVTRKCWNLLSKGKLRLYGDMGTLNLEFGRNQGGHNGRGVYPDWFRTMQECASNILFFTADRWKVTQTTQ